MRHASARGCPRDRIDVARAQARDTAPVLKARRDSGADRRVHLPGLPASAARTAHSVFGRHARESLERSIADDPDLDIRLAGERNLQNQTFAQFPLLKEVPICIVEDAPGACIAIKADG